MASNPMQKKSRNAFLLGMLLMLIIAIIIIAGMFFVLTKNNKKEKKEEVVRKKVMVASQDIKSGEEISEDNLKVLEVDENTIPIHAYGPSDIFDEEIGLYRNIKDQNGEEVPVPKYRAKVALEAGTVLNIDMLYEGELIDDSERIHEYNMLQLPVQLEQGEYVDVRLQFANGQNFIVVSHKEIKDISQETIWLQLSESEIALMSSAIVESYWTPTSNLYVTKYVEPGMQAAAAVTYVPSSAVLQSMENNPNIVKEAMDGLKKVYDNIHIREVQYKDFYRAWINNELSKVEAEEALTNIQAQMLEAREKAKEEREKFLSKVN